MRLAVPCQSNKVCDQFGDALQFAFFDADLASGRIDSQMTLAAPPDQPGILSKWVKAQGADVVLAVGMGGNAVSELAREGVDVVVGVILRDPRQAVEDYLGSMLTPAGAGTSKPN